MGRSFYLRKRHTIVFQPKLFNLFNRANYCVATYGGYAAGDIERTKRLVVWGKATCSERANAPAVRPTR